MKRIEILILDVDGILTDGSLYWEESGKLIKRFSFLDGAGIRLASDAGLRVGIISGHAFEGTRERFSRLGVAEEDLVVGVSDKRPAFDAILARHDLAPEQAAVMGDDVFDLPLFTQAGFKATVPQAHPEVISRADYVTHRAAGKGAVREVIDLWLKARGLYEGMLEGFLR